LFLKTTIHQGEMATRRLEITSVLLPAIPTRGIVAAIATASSTRPVRYVTTWIASGDRVVVRPLHPRYIRA